MTFLNRLRQQRGLAVHEGAAASKDAARAQSPAARVDATHVPKAAGKPAPVRAEGLSNAVMRQTIDDLFRDGDAARLSGPLVARHALAFNQEPAALREMGKAVAKSWDKLGEPARSSLIGLPM